MKDLNVFSGSNDSGKSNILRVLNLFFNKETDKSKPFSHERDLNIQKKNTGNTVIKIQIFFDISWDKTRDKFLPSKFSISKSYNKRGFRDTVCEFNINNIKDKIRINLENPEENKEIYKLFLPKNYDNLTPEEKEKIEKISKKREWGYRVKFLGFLNKSVSFRYVPAIKDRHFFSYLYGKTISQLLKTNNSKSQEDISNALALLEKKINDYSDALFDSAKFLSSEFKVGDNLQNFFENFDIGTGKSKNILLISRGDGIQAKFIPEILNFLDSISGEKYFIWGFEEPENSSEYKNQQELAQKFRIYSTNNQKQLLITTHSDEFLSLYDGSEVAKEKRIANLYHVKKIKNKKYKDFSIIQFFDVDNNVFENATIKSEIDKDLGTSHVRAKYSKELMKESKKLLIEKIKIEEESKEKVKEIKKCLRNTRPDNIFICEDENGVKTWGNIFKKCNIEDVKIISSKGCKNDDVEKWASMNIKNSKGNYEPKIFRSIDRDGYTKKQVNFLEKNLQLKNIAKLGIGNKKNYKIKFLPVNEMENFSVIKESSFSRISLSRDLKESFFKTAEANLLSIIKIFEETKKPNCKNLFGSHSSRESQKICMEEEALKNIKKFFPGKEIIKINRNFNSNKFIENINEADYPKELKKYIKEVKDFFA